MAGFIAAPKGCRSRHPSSKCSRRCSGGLHCGALPFCRTIFIVLVLPPFDGGLHCGPMNRIGRQTVQPVLPPLTGGLHCGSGVTLSCQPEMMTCSRRPTAGSIAAPAA
jgi:hypothetical protein